MKEGWMKNDEGWRLNDEGWWFQAVEGFCKRMNEWTDRQTDNICDCRAVFATENLLCYSMAIAESEQFKLDYDGTCTCPTGLNK